MKFRGKYGRFHRNAQKGRRYRMPYWSLFTGNVVALMCCYNITLSVADRVTIILLCGCLRKESPAKYLGLCGIEKMF